MKGKKALEKLYFDNKDLKVDIALNDFKVCEIYNIIKQDLDKLEKLEKENQELRKAIKQWNINGGNLLKENAKLKKAIEIIKEKKVDIPKLLANDFNNYNALAVFFGFKQLAQEEYELLKEVLDND